MAVSLEVEKLEKRFGTFEALRNVGLAVRPGELFFLLGPSGCGKTTLLRCVAGFERPDAGRVLVDGEDVTGLPPHQRGMGMMFQSYALWPHMTLAENVAFGLEMRRVPRAEVRRRVGEALEQVRLAERARARPGELSGGQQQRVALARALVVRPRCLLLDEPLSNLDAKLRLEMRGEIRRVCKEAGLTALYVTHDQKEALAVADRMAVMRDGQVEQVGTPAEVYRTPASRFVAGFVGEGNFIEGRVAGDLRVATAWGEFAAAGAAALPVGTAVTVCLRPEAVRLDAPPAGAVNRLAGRFRESVYLGETAVHEIEVPVADGTVEALRLKVCELNPAAETARAGDTATAWVAPEQVIVIAHT